MLGDLYSEYFSLGTSYVQNELHLWSLIRQHGSAYGILTLFSNCV